MLTFLSDKTVQTITDAFIKGKPVRKKLVHNGMIVIDQKLPFICVYRFKTTPGFYLSSLIKTQGAFLISDVNLDVSELLESLLAAAIKEFKTFMILEIWGEEDPEKAHTISLLYPSGKVPATISTLEQGFIEFNQMLPGLQVSLAETEQRHPENLAPLIALSTIKKTGALLVGIAIPPLFTDKEKSQEYPLFFRQIRRKFAELVKMAAFEFIRLQADNKFEHYLMLGKTQLDNLIRTTDEKMADISEKMNFILSVTPVNATAEWRNFQKNDFAKAPQFNYRLISVDPELEKRNLFNLPIENIEHPTIAFLLRDKRMELEKQLVMLEERGTKNFFYTSQSIFGAVEDELKNAALSLLTDAQSNELSEYEAVHAEKFATAANIELDKYRKLFPQLALKVEVKETVSGLVVSGAELSVGKDVSISGERVEALIQHEVGTHLLTYCNGHLQPLKLMYAGLAGYEQIQEGMAVLSEFLVGGLNINRLKLLAARVIAVDALVAGADFITIYRMLCDDYGFSGKTAFNITMRVHRGGGYTKDAIYLKGLIQLLQFIHAGGDITYLYGGKFALEHLPLIEELMHLQILKKPCLPAYLSSEKAKEQLARIRNGIQLKELVN